MVRHLKYWLALFLPALLVTACLTVAAEAPETSQQVEEPTLVQAQAEKEIEAGPAQQVEAEVVAPAQKSTLPAGAPLLQFVGQEHVLHLIDPSTGTDLAGYEPLALSGYVVGHSAMSPQRDKLAALSSPASIACTPGGCRVPGSVLQLINPATWTAQTLELGGATNVLSYPAGNLAFNPNGTELAVTYAGPGSEKSRLGTYWLATVDPAGPSLGVTTPLDIAPRFLAYTADGESLLLYGVPYTLDKSQGQAAEKPGTPRLILFKAADLSVVWQTDLPGLRDGYTWANTAAEPVGELWQPGVVFAAERGRLYIVHAAEAKLTTIDPAAQAVETVALQAKQSWLDRLLELTADVAYAKMLNGVTSQAILSADESRLYVLSVHYEAGEGQPTSSTLQAIDPTAGTIIAERTTDAYNLTMHADQNQLYLQRDDGVSAWTDVVDGGRLEAMTDRLPHSVRPATTLAGQPILLASDNNDTTTDLATLDPETFAVIHTWQVKGYTEWVIAP